MRSWWKILLVLFVVGSAAPGYVFAQTSVIRLGFVEDPSEPASKQEKKKEENDNGDKGENGKDKKDDEKKPKKPKTLFEWAIGTEPEKESEEGEDVIATDRPDFVESSRNIGRGRVQLESGYTYIRDQSNGTKTVRHSYPEALLRMGLFADWFELRMSPNWARETSTENGQRTVQQGAEDLYLGIGLWLTEQKGVLPESRINLQTFVPTGSRPFTAGQMLPGINYLCGWDVIEDCFTIGTAFGVNRRVEDNGHYYVEIAPAITFGISFTKKLGMYVETFGLMPTSALTVLPEWYGDSGFTYKITNNFQVDIRAGIGLNRSANDFFTGTGFAVRY